MRRRDLIGIIAGLAIQPAKAGNIPVIGFLHPASPDGNADRVRAFRDGLKDLGLIDGENVTIEYRWAENQAHRLPTLAMDLVRRPVDAMVVFGPVATFAAKAATAVIPIVFVSPEDPVRLGLVQSLARPGGNLTGVNFFPSEVSGKRLELLREMVPGAARIALLLESTNPMASESTLNDVQAAASALGIRIDVHRVSTSREIDSVFEVVPNRRPDGLMTAVSAFLVDRRVQLALQAATHRVPAIYPLREFVEAGGLMSYGASLRSATREVGNYVGRILKGERPTDLPVIQATKFELVINHQTARSLGISVPVALLARADDVIE
jgi:putative ABC transport system substrate-binding protein